MIVSVTDPRPRINVKVEGGTSAVNVTPSSPSPVVIVTAAGPQGPAGRDAIPGQDFLVHEQITPAATWTISHTLSAYPDVAVVVDKRAVITDTIYPDQTTVVLVFAVPTSGTAYLRK